VVNCPLLSVIIPSYNSSATIAACLSSILRQHGQVPLEVIVVDGSTDETAAIIRSDFPEVRLISRHERMYPGAARNLGAAQAQGNLLAFIDADCTVGPDFAEEVARCWQQEGYPVLAGAIQNGNPENYIGWGYYFSSFSAWMPCSDTVNSTFRDAATGCFVIARSVFEKHGPFSEARFCEDTLLSWRLRKVGLPPRFVPTVIVYHTNPDQLDDWLKRRYLHGRAFARLRSQEWGLLRRERLLRLLGAPLVPAVLLYRSARSIVDDRTYLREFLLALPLTALGHIAWSCGEFAEYCSSQPAGDT
jgi:GT2 family glycosyltransferase